MNQCQTESHQYYVLLLLLPLLQPIGQRPDLKANGERYGPVS
jgi:hypothetical protein